MSRLIHLSLVLALLVCLTGNIWANPIGDDRVSLNELLSSKEPADDAELVKYSGVPIQDRFLDWIKGLEHAKDLAKRSARALPNTVTDYLKKRNTCINVE